MSCTISISRAPEDIWMIRNAIFRWLNRIIRTRFAGEPDLVEAMRVAEYCGGISLDPARTEDPHLAGRIVGSLLILSKEIADGRHELRDDQENPWPELQKDCETAFRDLNAILARWDRMDKIKEKPTTGTIRR